VRNIFNRAGYAKGLLIAASLILAGQAAALHLLSLPERELPVPGLHSLPLEFGEWKGAGEQTLDADVTAYLKPDEYVIRDFVNRRTGASVDVFIAYFKSVQNVYGPHSPSVCLPGSGWLVRGSKIVNVQVAGPAESIPVNEYRLEKGDNRILAVYWYENDRHVWAEEFRGKLALLPDLLRYHRSDVSLVRMVFPIRDVTGDEARASYPEFIRLVFPKLVERFQSVN